MTTLNLHDITKSDVQFKLNRFPDGEVQVTDLEVDKLKENMTIIAPIRNAEELFVFLQLLGLIHDNINCVNIVIPYLMGARNDRDMDKGRSANLFIVLYMIHNEMFLKRDTLTFITIHNMQAVKIWFEDEYDDGTFNKNREQLRFVDPYPQFTTTEEEMVVFPDKGAEVRFKHLVTGPYLVATKARDINQIESAIITYELLNPNNYDLRKIKKVIIIDDLVDGGKTFRLLANELDRIMAEQVFSKDLYLTHFIQEEKLISLTEYYDNIYVCDTFRPVPTHEQIHKLKDVEDMI